MAVIYEVERYHDKPYIVVSPLGVERGFATAIEAERRAVQITSETGHTAWTYMTVLKVFPQDLTRALETGNLARQMRPSERAMDASTWPIRAGGERHAK